MYSSKWKNWKSIVDLKTCVACKEKNGSIYAIQERVFPRPPLHFGCRCTIERMYTIIAGTATDSGADGADWYIKNLKILPSNYISRSTAKSLGWIAKNGNLDKVAPGKMIFGGVYYNREGKLPHSLGRVWYEADINYASGRRNTERLLFSNDGLIFVTYDHYTTFYEIV